MWIGRPILSLAAVPFLLGTCNGTVGPSVRPPTPQERAKIIRAVTGAWEYESHPLPAGEQIHLRRPNLRPRVVRIAVARADARFSSAVVELRDAKGRRRGSPAVMVFQRIDHDRWSEKEFGVWIIEGPTTVVSRACTPATPRGIRALVCPDPWSVLRYPRPRTRPQARYTQEISSPGLHAVDWKKVKLPGGVCGSSRPISPWAVTRWSGQAFIHADVDLLWWNPVWVYSWEKPVFGDLDGDGRDEAALHVVCANGGGTAAGQLAFSEVIFKAVGTSLRVVGIVTPRQPVTADAGHVPLIGRVDIEPGRVIAPEYWYGPYDGSCCASGEARTIWTYGHGRLRRARTTILQKPWTSLLYIPEVLAEPGTHELHSEETTRVPASPRLRFEVAVGTHGGDKRNVRITLMIRQSSTTIVRTKTVERISGITLESNVVFSDLPSVQPGRATVTIEAHDPGAHPLRYPVIFTRS